MEFAAEMLQPPGSTGMGSARDRGRASLPANRPPVHVDDPRCLPDRSVKADPWRAPTPGQDRGAPSSVGRRRRLTPFGRPRRSAFISRSDGTEA